MMLIVMLSIITFDYINFIITLYLYYVTHICCMLILHFLSLSIATYFISPDSLRLNFTFYYRFIIIIFIFFLSFGHNIIPNAYAFVIVIFSLLCLCQLLLGYYSFLFDHICL